MRAELERASKQLVLLTPLGLTILPNFGSTFLPYFLIKKEKENICVNQ
jgi:hypothetical protein